jgi:DNA-binding IclR family transcriptional regulator
MREITSYLDGKAMRVKQMKKTDPAPYATASELAEQLNARMNSTCRALATLRECGRVRMYPRRSPELRNRKYGSTVLPEVTYDEVFGEIMKTSAPLAILLHSR